MSNGYTPSLKSFRQMHLAALGIVAIFTIIVAMRTKSGFAWVTAVAAVLSAIVAYMSIIPTSREEA